MQEPDNKSISHNFKGQLISCNFKKIKRMGAHAIRLHPCL